MGKWLMDNLFDQKLPPTVRNGLASMELNVKDPTDYFAQADKLLASDKAKQTQVSEVKRKARLTTSKAAAAKTKERLVQEKGLGKRPAQTTSPSTSGTEKKPGDAQSPTNANSP